MYLCLHSVISTTHTYMNIYIHVCIYINIYVLNEELTPTFALHFTIHTKVLQRNLQQFYTLFITCVKLNDRKHYIIHETVILNVPDSLITHNFNPRF